MAERRWEVDVVARQEPLDRFDDGLLDRDGRVLHTIELEDALGYVVPIEFDASCQDDPALPVDVTLSVWVTNTAGAVVTSVRLDPRQSRVEVRGRRWPLTLPEQNYIGPIPELPVPQLLRDALAHAAMPKSRPMIDEMGYHAATVLKTLPDRRAPRIAGDDRELFLHLYAQALANERLETETERLAAVWGQLHERDPERWPTLVSVRRLKQDADAVLGRVGGWDSFGLQPGSYELPEDWPPER